MSEVEQKNQSKKERVPKKERNEKEKKKREPKEKREKVTITLETVIPELPKKSQRIPQPNEEEHKKSVKKIQDSIDTQYDKLHKYIDEIKNAITETKNKTGSTPAREMLIQKKTQKATLYEEFNYQSGQFNEIKKKIEELFNQSQKLRQKMKIIKKKSELEADLKEMKDKQAFSNLSLQEEKTIIKDIADLEKTIPLAQPLEEITEEMAKLKKEQNEFKTKMNAAHKQIQTLKSEINEIQEDLNNQKKEKSETINSLNPLIATKKEEFKQKIDDLKQQRSEMQKKHNDQWSQYKEQQELIRQVEWMTKVKRRLQREQEMKEQDEIERKEMEEQKAKIKELAHQEDIDLCDRLIDYCNSLNPNRNKGNKQVEQKQQVDIDQVLKSAEWKKDNCTLITSKKDRDIDEPVNNKKKKNNKKQQQVKPQDENLPLQHKLDVLGYFEHVKVNPPLFTSRVEECMKILEEKKQYFKTLSESENQEVKENVEIEKKEKKQKQKKIEEMGEEEFPSM